MKQEVVKAATDIILNAGDARNYCKEALDLIADCNIAMAKEKMKQAQEKIVVAHRIQTDAIQGETQGNKMEYTVLFAHAQDTLMTIYSEINIAKQMIKIFENWERRLQKLEAKQ